jgi:sugar phosphate isomerase/epimerase
MGNNHTRRHFLQVTAAASLTPTAAVLAQTASTPGPGTSRTLTSAQPMINRPFQLGLASYTLRKFGLDDTIKMTKRVALKNIAFKDSHLPLNSSPETIKSVAAKVNSAGLNLYGCGVVYMKSEKDVNQAFEYAKAAAMKTIIAAPIHELLPLVDKMVKEYDIAVAIHNHGPGDKVFPTPESVHEKVKDLDKRIGLCMDIGHTTRIGEDPSRDAVRFADRLVDIHIKDVSAAKPEGGTVEVGRGVIDIPTFMRTLYRIQYKGYVSFEYEKDADDPLPGLAESVGYVNGVIATIEQPGYMMPSRPASARTNAARPR